MRNTLAFAARRTRPQLDLAALRATAQRDADFIESDVNPMRRGALRNGNRRGDLALVPRCEAHCKHDRRPCRQPAMRGRRVCRMHGGKAGAPRGERHGRYRHGMRSHAMTELFAAFRRVGRDMDAMIARAKAGARQRRAQCRRG